ncbi:MAG TPA: sugar ABC transporter permease [Spirochaetia bacterium]|nr:sugar ABC transporter permease [Spirochaetia bacterium]
MSRTTRSRSEEVLAYWTMVLPALLLYLLVLGFPIVISVILSLSNYNGGKMFGGQPWTIVGVQQYQKLVKDPYFWMALKNNIYIVLISVFGQLPLGFTFAYLIYRKIVKGGEFWQAVLYMPQIISVIVLGIMWSIIFSPSGVIAEVMNRIYSAQISHRIDAIFAAAGGFHITDDVIHKLIAASGNVAGQTFTTNPPEELKQLILTYSPDNLDLLKHDLVNLLGAKWTPTFLTKPNVAMLPVLFVILWCWTGLYLILFLANMQKIDPQVIEAARIDGATEGQVMSRVVLPSLSGVIVNSAILCIAGSLNSFALVFAMTGGGPARVTELLSIYMYNAAFVGRPDFPLANAISLAIVIFSMVLIVITKLVERRYGGRE